MWTPKARLELLRLLAFLTGDEIRTLRNWHLRRRLRNGFTGAAAVITLLLAIALYPIEDWKPLSLTFKNQPLYPIAAEMLSDKLLMASRFKARGPQGFRNIIQLTEYNPEGNTLREKPVMDYNEKSPFRRRLLPALLYNPPDTVNTYIKSVIHRSPQGRPFVTELMPGKFILVQPLSLEDSAAAEEEYHESSKPIPYSEGSVIAVINDSTVHFVEVPELSPHWEPRDSFGPTSPAKGISVASSEGGKIWLGIPGWDAREPGGLWHSSDNGHTWVRMKGFANVSSVTVQEEAGKLKSVTVAESYFETWQGIGLQPYLARVVEQRVGDSVWRQAAAPPFGSSSEVEFCGILRGAQVVRVDRTLYLRDNIPLWRFLWK